MFVSKISEVDFFLSQMNVLLSKVNEKLDECPVNSRSVIVPRIHHIVSELEWMMSLSTKGSQIVDKNGNSVRLSCVNWFGAHMERYVVNGLDLVDINEIA